MAEKIVSPGVFTKEIDKTFLPAAVADIGAAIVGPTVKGPPNIPIVVTSYSEFQAIFGDTFESGSGTVGEDYTYLTSMAAKNYLQHSDTLVVVRILAGSPTAASATISSSIDPAVVGGGTLAGGTKAKSQFKLDNTYNFISGSAPRSASFTHNGTRVDFVFQGTGSNTTYRENNTAADKTIIYVATGSYTTGSTATAGDNPDIAKSFAYAINQTQTTHGLPISASHFTVHPVGHGAGITGSVPVGQQTQSVYGVVGITSSKAGAYDGERVIGGPGYYSTANIYTSNLSGSLFVITGSFMTGSGLGIPPTAVSGGQTSTSSSLLYLDGGFYPSFKTPFKLHTLAYGEIMNNKSANEAAGLEGKDNILLSGSKDNLRWEVSNVNYDKGIFDIVIRKGNDTHKRKRILETWNSLTLDSAEDNYIAKVIGDSYLTIQGSGTTEPYLKSIGKFPNQSKYVRVEVLEQTSEYLDDNGNVRVPEASASLPSFVSGSNSGSFGGSFTGGGDGTVQHPKKFYSNITKTNVQGLDPTTDASGKSSYEDALNLLSNQDQYDFNLLLLPGIISAEHSAIASKAIDVCEDRGDCFVILDPVLYGKTIKNATTQANTRNSNYAGMYWPWVQVNEVQLGQNVWVPPSVAIGGMYAFNDKVAQPWFAPAGLNRGTLGTVIQAERKLTQTNRDTLYDNNLNPVATFPGQGVTVWGQKTLQKKASALDRINIRRLLIKVKKFIASTSRFLVFEQNNAQTRQRFLNIANPFLEQVQSQSGLDTFRVIMDETNNTPDVVDRNILYGQLFLQPTRTAEFIVLDFTIQPAGAAFED
jgi:hypothetical protein